jgi:hypothetical protein
MKTPDLNGWEKLICPFFAETCRHALGSYLEDNGFREFKQNQIGGLLFSRFGVFLEISYVLEVFPQDLTISLGTSQELYDSDGRPCFIPYWYLLPMGSNERNANFTGFKTKTELESLFENFAKLFLETHFKSLWMKVDNLEKMILNFQSEFC